MPDARRHTNHLSVDPGLARYYRISRMMGEDPLHVCGQCCAVQSSGSPVGQFVSHARTQYAKLNMSV